jgi:hypothetical protein
MTTPPIKSNEYGAWFAVPVTLREVEDQHVSINNVSGFLHTIPLDSNFGMDDAEHAELLDDPSILRVTFAIEWDRETNTIYETYGLQAYSARLGRDPQWDDCINLRALEHAARSIHRANWFSVVSAIRQIAKAHADVDAILGEARKPFDAMVAELEEQAAQDE